MTENDMAGAGIPDDSRPDDEKPDRENASDGLALPPFLAVLLRQAKAESASNTAPDRLLGAWATFETEGKKT